MSRRLKFLRRWGLRFFIVIALGIAGFWAAVRWWPYPSDLSRGPQACTWITDCHGQPLAAYVGDSGQWQVPLEENEISPHVMDAIVAVEDRRFYDHGGVDWRSLGGAVLEDAAAMRLGRGASTITMQLCRLRDPTPRSIVGKLTQMVRAEQMERRMGKRQILVDYLNEAPFGGNLVGVGAASWRYFGRLCRELSLGQAALLAGIPQNPNGLRPDRHPQLARQRRDIVLDRMLSAGMIDAAQRDLAQQEPIDAQWRPLPQDDQEIGLRPTLADLARRYPCQRVRTTIDPAVQRQAALEAAEVLKEFSASHVTAAAVVVVDTPSGRCLAAVSLTTGWSANDVDLTTRPRSSGSTLKPFIYGAAFDAGVCGPGIMLDDSAESWSGYEPENYDREFWGKLPAAEALAQSRNVPAMWVLSHVGVERAVAVMGAMGLHGLAKKPQRYGLPLAIGGAEVTPMELAQGYATLARGGVDREVSLVESGTEQNLKPGILRSAICRETLNCLADPLRTENVCQGAAALGAAWKTGTSGGHRDAWCAAVTPRRTVVVWLGNPDGSGSDQLVGQEAAAPVALRILTETDATDAAQAAETVQPGFAPPTDFWDGRDAQTASLKIAAIQILSPQNGDTVVRDPAVSADQQRVALRATGDVEIWWFVDGIYLGKCGHGETVFWTAVPGKHEARAVTADGRAASVKFAVQ